MEGLQGLWCGYIGKTLVIGKNEVKHWVHGRVGGPRVLSVKVSQRISGDLYLVVGLYGGVPLRAR